MGRYPGAVHAQQQPTNLDSRTQAPGANTDKNMYGHRPINQDVLCCGTAMLGVGMF